MQTITFFFFYSYNGGTGRTLAVANAAKHLVRLGQKVFAMMTWTLEARQDFIISF